MGEELHVYLDIPDEYRPGGKAALEGYGMDMEQAKQEFPAAGRQHGRS